MFLLKVFLFKSFIFINRKCLFSLLAHLFIFSLIFCNTFLTFYLIFCRNLSFRMPIKDIYISTQSPWPWLRFFTGLNTILFNPFRNRCIWYFIDIIIKFFYLFMSMRIYYINQFIGLKIFTYLFNLIMINL